mgnify:CR=1 FL=1
MNNCKKNICDEHKLDENGCCKFCKIKFLKWEKKIIHGVECEVANNSESLRKWKEEK